MSIIIVLMLIAVGFSSAMIFFSYDSIKKEVPKALETPKENFKPVKPIRQVIEEALPKTPVGCMWSVKKVKREWWEGYTDVPIAYRAKIDKVKKNISIGHKKEWKTLTPEDDLWKYVPDSAKNSKIVLEIEFHSPDDNVVKTEIPFGNDLSNEQIITKITSIINDRCVRIVDKYIRDNEVWDGVYIKNELDT